MIVVCVDGDGVRRELIARAARAAGAEARTFATAAEAVAAAASAQLVVGGGEVGVRALQRLAAARSRTPRLALTPISDGGRVVNLVERVRPFGLVPEPIDLARVTEAIAVALGEGAADGETTARFAVPVEQPDFDRLTVDSRSGVVAAPYLRLRLEEEALRSRRYARPLSLGLLDVDRLRELADERGRDVSEAALQQVAQILSRGARTVDLVGRWGAGSFALLLPETAASAAWTICERLRGQVASARLAAADGPLGVRISAGVAVNPRRGTASELVTRADAALARAKREGGDRTISDERR